VRTRRFRGIPALLIGLALTAGAGPARASGFMDQITGFFEKTKDAMKGAAPVHKLSLFSSVQNYQVSGSRAMRSMVVMLELSGDEALRYVCVNRPRFKEAILRAATKFYRDSRGHTEITEDEMRRMARPIFESYLHKDWLLKLDARLVKDSNAAGPEVMRTEETCKAYR